MTKQAQRLAPMMLPEHMYRKVVDELALELFLTGERRSAITNQLQNFIKDPRLNAQRAFYRKIARRAIDFARDEYGPMAQCVVCGCTDAEACPEGCSWIVVNRFAGKGVCSNCAEPQS